MQLARSLSVSRICACQEKSETDELLGRTFTSLNKSLHPELPTKMQGRKRVWIKFKLEAQSKDITKLKKVSREFSHYLAIEKSANKTLSQENGLVQSINVKGTQNKITNAKISHLDLKLPVKKSSRDKVIRT